MTDTAPEPTPDDPGVDTAEHPIADALAERLEGGPPPRDDPPDGERSDPHAPPLDRLDDYVNLKEDDPRRIEAARILAGRAVDPEGERPEGEHYQRGDESPGEVGDDPRRGH